METFPQSQNQQEQAQKEKALEMNKQIQKSLEDLVIQVKNLQDGDGNLKEAISKYSGNPIELFDSFQFQAFNDARDIGNRSMLTGPGNIPFEGYLASNKNVSLEELQKVKESFEERKKEIISRLSKRFGAPEEAFKEVERIHKELVLPVLNEKGVFSN